MPATDPARALARDIADLRRRVEAMERGSQASHRSLEMGGRSITLPQVYEGSQEAMSTAGGAVVDAAAARARAEAATLTAQAAASRADDAEAAALEAAGIAADAGKIVYTESDPEGDANTLWLRPPDWVPHRWDGDSWEPVRDAGIAAAAQAAADAEAAASAAAQSAQAAQNTANEASGIAQSALTTAQGKNTVTYSTVSPTSATPGIRNGDIWWKIDSSNRVIGTWRWDSSATTWSAATFADEVLNSLTAAKITTGVLQAGARIIAGPESGTHAELTGTGIHIFAADPVDNIPNEVIRLGTSSSDYFGIVDPSGRLVASISGTGSTSVESLNSRSWPVIGSPDYTGRGGSLLDILDRRPRGIVGWGARYTDSPDAVNLQGVGVFEFGVRLYEGRLYKITSSTIRVESSHDGNLAEVQLRWTLGGLNGSSAPASPTINSEVVTRVQTVVNVASLAPGAAKIQGVQLSKIVGFSGTTGWRDFRFLLTHSMFGEGNTVLKAGSGDVLEIWVEDIGPYTGNLQQANTGGGTSTGGAASPPPAAPPPQQYSRSWSASWSRGYRQNGQPRTDTASIYQGYGDSFNGNQWSMIGFPDITGELAGATVTSVSLYLFAEHWWNGDGGTAAIGRHSYTSQPATLGPDRVDAMAMEPFGRSQGRWIDLSAHGAQGWATGTVRGVVLGFAGAGTNPQYYGRFTPANYSPTSPVINITYVK